MKLASLKHGRDGRLVVVSRDLKRAVEAGDIAPNLQVALDDWDKAAPQLKARYEQLNAGQLKALHLMRALAHLRYRVPMHGWMDRLISIMLSL